MSYPPSERRIWLDKGPLTKADVLKADAPPTWSAGDERAFRRYWSQPHVSSPDAEEVRKMWLKRARAEAQAMTSAQEWQQYFKEVGR